MKKILSLLFLLGIVVVLAACNQNTAQAPAAETAETAQPAALTEAAPPSCDGLKEAAEKALCEKGLSKAKNIDILNRAVPALDRPLCGTIDDAAMKKDCLAQIEALEKVQAQQAVDQKINQALQAALAKKDPNECASLKDAALEKICREGYDINQQ